MEGNPSNLNEGARGALSWVEKHFLHPRLGLPYDYFSPAGEVPRRSFGGLRDVKQNLPNAHGFGAGFALSAQNLALLMDATLLRLECGVAAPAEEALAGKMAEGLLRLATTAPKGALVRGLTGDGHSYYAGIDAAVATAFAFGAWRSLATPCLAPDAQARIRAAAAGWIERLEAANFVLSFPDGRPLPGGDLTVPANGLRGPWPLALSAFAHWLRPSPGRLERYNRLAGEAEGARLRPAAATDAADGAAEGEAAEGDDSWCALWRQYARRLAGELDPDGGRREVWRETWRAAAAGQLREGLGDWRKFDPSRYPAPVVYDWRAAPRPADGPGAKDGGAPGCGGWSERRTGFVRPESWARLDDESSTLRAPLARALAILLSGAPDLCARVAEEIPPLLEIFPRLQPQTCAVAGLAAGAHAHGLALGLWDAGLADSRRVPPAKQESLAARYLEDDYDEKHPGQAGHGDPKTPEKSDARGGGRSKHRRRRRR